MHRARTATATAAVMAAFNFHVAQNPGTFCLAFDELEKGRCARRLFVAYSAEEMRSCMEHLRGAWRTAIPTLDRIEYAREKVVQIALLAPNARIGPMAVCAWPRQ